MKAEELMVGDWVHYRGTNIQVTSLYNKGGSNEIGWSEKESVWVNGSNVEPIPLTPEILKKNGFTKHVYGFSFQYLKLLGNLRNDDTVYFTITISGKDITINYIHQLQHALRLCGINKEIVL